MVLIANYHAPDEKETVACINVLRAFGAEKIVEQRDAFDPALYFEMLGLISVPELQRMPQFKAADKENQTAQLLTYPVLMAHDVIGYEEVYVGEDQLPHIDLARRIIGRYNRKHSTYLPCPKPVVSVGKITDLQDSSKKMSKSSPKGCLFLDDSAEEIAQKIKKAVTDTAGVENLRVLYNEFVGGSLPERYGEAKTALSSAIAEKFGAARTKARNLVLDQLVEKSQADGEYS